MARLWIRTRYFGEARSCVPPPLLPPHRSSFLHLNPGGPLAFLSGWYREDYSSSFLFLVKTKLPEGHFDVLHPGQPPPGGPDHEGGAAPHRHDPGPLLDAGRRDFGRQHSGPEVKISPKPCNFLSALRCQPVASCHS